VAVNARRIRIGTKDMATTGIRASAARAEVIAPSRLHLGFIDPSGALGRRFGSIGLAIDTPCTRLSALAAPGIEVSGPCADRARRFAAQALAAAGIAAGIRLTIHAAIPQHAGLGSGTQLALAVARAVAAVYDLPFDATAAAVLTERGARSGIGAAVFAQGGFVVDGGRGAHTAVPPVISRIEFPSTWRLLLVLDTERNGLNGAAEPAAFANLGPLARTAASDLAQRVLMQLLPALAERDFVTAAAALGAIQAVLGDYFAPAQGSRYSSPDVAAVAGWLAARGWSGVGQSSWGPTGFALLPSAAEATRVLVDARREWQHRPGLRFIVCQGRNDGAACTIDRTALLQHAHGSG
jgi:beta-RFAP synthase